MMSEFYDHYHRWEPLAEFHFNYIDENEERDENYMYCLCSRAFIRDGVNTYYVDNKEYGSESDIDVRQNSQSQECDEHSHVHFSLDTSYKVKCEKDEGASCYCSASHTDNYCSTDEHDPAQIHAVPSHNLQPSDSGADLTYQDCHSDYIEKMDHDYQLTPDTDENYLAEDTWVKFWSVNSERLIWASWIKKYSEYINPAYLSENNDLVMDENSIPKPHSAEAIFNPQTDSSSKIDEGRERKFSYDSKVNPYKKLNSDVKKNERAIEISDSKDDTWVPVSRRRSCSEHERILSPKTLAGTDSMTNVTKITISSYDITSSHVTSESSPTDDYSVSSTNSEDQTHDQTRIANIDESMDLVPSEEVDSEQYWQFLWKKHFGEQYALHYASYIECHDTKNQHLNNIHVESIVDKRLDEKLLDIECENSEGNSQEISSVIEVQTKVEVININENKKEDIANEDDKNTEVDGVDILEDEPLKPDIPIVEDKAKKTRKRKSRAKDFRVIGSVGLLLQTLLKEQKEENDSTQVMDSGDNNNVSNTTNTDNTDSGAVDSANGITQNSLSHQSVDQSNMSGYSYDDGDDEPPEQQSRSLKRSHEVDDDDVERDNSELIKSTFEIMGFRIDTEKMPKGDLLYRKRFHRLRPPRYKKFAAKKTYFDDDGNPLSDYQCHESEEDNAMRTEDDDVADNQSNNEIDTFNVNETSESVTETGHESENNKQLEIKDDGAERIETDPFKVPLPPELESSSDAQENKEENCEGSTKNTETKRRRRQKRHSRHEIERIVDTDIPEDIRSVPKMMKYWKKRHSLFHRFDEGIKLDVESWFSVTPENVAWHIASKCAQSGYQVVLDGFCGAGGNTIQFAKACEKVIAIDIDPAKIALARHNAAVYGVEDRVQFVVGDFFELASTFSADLVFLSPPWGGPKYSSNKVYDIETMLEPKPASELMRTAQQVSSNVAMYLPRNTSTDQILSIAQEVGGSVEIEQSYLDKRFVAITAYFYSYIC